jgi:small basic protein
MNEYFVMLWALLQGKLIALAVVTLLDIVFGVIVALVKKEFKWEYLMHYLSSDVLPIFAWVGVVVLTTIPAENIPSGVLPIASDAVYATVFLGILASVLKSFTELGILKEALGKIGI